MDTSVVIRQLSCTILRTLCHVTCSFHTVKTRTYFTLLENSSRKCDIILVEGVSEWLFEGLSISNSRRRMLKSGLNAHMSYNKLFENGRIHRLADLSLDKQLTKAIPAAC